MNSNPQSIAIADFDYPLPDDRIAKFPLERRDQSKLLVYRGGNIEESRFDHVPELLPPDTLLIFNNTKVIHARLFFRKPTGSTIEVFCLEPFQMPVALSFEQRGHCTWNCFIGNNKKWKEGSLTRQLDIHGQSVTLTATRRKAVGNAWIVDFDWDGGLSFAELIDQAGVIPLPPYLHREAVSSDNERYQTVYALHQGSVAAPTAGLHFSPEVFEALRQKGIATDFITLHVGAGTFKPVKTESIEDHEMHSEYIFVPLQTIDALMRHNGECTCVGTTSVRTIESLYYIGLNMINHPDISEEGLKVEQWQPYAGTASVSEMDALKAIRDYMVRHQLQALHTSTQIIIAPGYRYHFVKRLITNFHMPKSTLLLLVSAFIGEDWRKVYQYALDNDFRFLSYGDSSILIP